MENLKNLDFEGKDIANGEFVTGQLEMIRMDGDNHDTLVINAGDFKSICYPDSIKLLGLISDKY